nr:MAG TPA: hypothetical protein [Caudoviricetes sp.]
MVTLHIVYQHLKLVVHSYHTKIYMMVVREYMLHQEIRKTFYLLQRDRYMQLTTERMVV